MLNSSILTQFTQALSRFQQALMNHDHPNLALQDHTHPEYLPSNDPRLQTPDLFFTTNSVGGIITLDLSSSRTFNVYLTEDVTDIVYINFPNNTDYVDIDIFIHQNNLTAYNFKMDLFEWAGGLATYTTNSTVLSAIDLLSIKYRPGFGTITYVKSFLKNMYQPPL